MREWLLRAGVAPNSVNYDQHVLVARGALDNPQVFWVRVDSPGGRLTGWRLAPMDLGEGELEVDSLPVHEIWRKRPALLQTLLLPAGWMAYYEGDEVVALVNPSNQMVWPEPEGEGAQEETQAGV